MCARGKSSEGSAGTCLSPPSWKCSELGMRRAVAARAQPVCPTHPRGSTRRMRHTPPPFATPSTRGNCGWMETVMGGAARSRHGGATAATRGDADTEANAMLEVEKLLDSEQPRLWSNLDGTASSLARDKGSMSGAVFLVAGTTVGAGILALPAETQPSGFVASTVAIVVCWAYMVRRRSHTRTRCCSPHVPRVPFTAMEPEGCVRIPPLGVWVGRRTAEAAR